MLTFLRRYEHFIPNFKRKQITDDDYFTKIIHYIHANPVHHGFVKEIADWPWSSFNYILHEKPSLVKREEIIQWFGNLEEFLKYHQQPIEEKLLESFQLSKS